MILRFINIDDEPLVGGFVEIHHYVINSSGVRMKIITDRQVYTEP